MSKNRVRRFDKNQTKIKRKRRLNKLRSFARALCVVSHLGNHRDPLAGKLTSKPELF